MRLRGAQVLEQDRAPALFNLVFGEGIVNDATTVAVLRTVQARATLRLRSEIPPAAACGAVSFAPSQITQTCSRVLVHWLLTVCCKRSEELMCPFMFHVHLRQPRTTLSTCWRAQRPPKRGSGVGASHGPLLPQFHT